MGEKDIRYEIMCRAINAIREAVFDWLSPDEKGYRDSVNYIQGILEMVRAIDQVLDDK